VLSAASLALLPRFDGGTALSLIARDRVTVFEGVPTMFSRMLDAPGTEGFDVTPLRLCLSGGAAMPVPVMRAFEQTFGRGAGGLRAVGDLAGGLVQPSARQHEPGSIGTPVRGVEVRLVDDGGRDVPRGEVGEIAVHGPNVMKGYWGKPEETAKAIRTGGSAPATWPGRTRTATSSSWTARRR
jgi:long-chain acyl-CoA synthetase